MMIAVELVILVGDAVHLVGPQVMRIGRPAARGLDPVGNRLAVGPIIMRRSRRYKREARAEAGERAAHRQRPAGRAGKFPCRPPARKADNWPRRAQVTV